MFRGMFAELARIGLRPTIAGVAVLGIGLLAGQGLAAHPEFVPVRAIRFWLSRVLIPGARHARFVVRFLTVFCNNACTSALLIAAGAFPGGAWVAVAAVSVSMGIAIRVLAAGDLPWPRGDEEAARDGWVRFGMLLNLLEAPAIVIVLGLSMGRLAAPNGLKTAEIWHIFATIVLPVLIIAAAGEALWLGRVRVP